MLTYSQPELDLLYQLINEANPGLYEPSALANTQISAPRTRTPGPGEIGDTEVDLIPLPGSYYIGKQTVNYRRIDLAKLFANSIPRFDRWNSGDLTTALLVTWLNEKYGLALGATDLPTTTWASALTTRDVAVQASSLCYQGTLSFIWNMGKRDLTQIITPDQLFAGRVWDTVYDPAKPLMTINGYGIDYSSFLTGINSLANGSAINSSAVVVRNLVDWFAQYVGYTLSVDTDHTQVGGLSGLTVSKFSLPNVAVPEADASNYNSVLVVSAQPTSWFCGKLLMHYNV